MNLVVNWRRVLTQAGLVSLAVIYALLWARMISNPSQRTGTDFIAFYTAGKIAQEHGTSQIYNIFLQQSIQNDIVGFKLTDGQVLLFNHLPFLIPLLSPFITESYVFSFSIWALFLFGLYLAAALQCLKLYPQNWPMQEKILFTIATITFFPFFISIFLGQDSAFLIFGMALFCNGILRKNDTLTGLGLTIMLVRPHIGLSFAIPLFFYRPKAFFIFSASAFLLTLLSILLLGQRGILEFFRILLISADGKWYGMNESAMFNIIGLLMRDFSFLGKQTIHSFGWGVYFLSIVCFSFLWFKSKKISAHLLGITILSYMLAVPHFHYHDLGLIIFPLLFAITFFKINQPSFILVGVSILFMFGKAVSTLEFILPYLAMFILFLILSSQKNRGYAKKAC